MFVADLSDFYPFSGIASAQQHIADGRLGGLHKFRKFPTTRL
ncbi:hypothetical protein C4K38_3683 [Pseudomonas chlororaphis subsp. piscium]|nr:hypothetical protein C4K38_3683 [Pseudomonas chlororaphis subsp. piscium]